MSEEITTGFDIALAVPINKSIHKLISNILTYNY